MKNIITKSAALSTALTFIPETETEVREVISKMVAQLGKSRSDASKAKQNAKRKEQNAQARAELVAKVAPVLRNYLTADITAKDLFEVAKGELPDGFTVGKVQAVLLREMASELIKTETKGKANTYRLA